MPFSRNYHLFLYCLMIPSIHPLAHDSSELHRFFRINSRFMHEALYIPP